MAEKAQAAPKPSKSPAALAAEASSQAVKATAKADKTAATALDRAPQRQMTRVVGLKHHECKIIKKRIKIVKGEETQVSKFVYDVLTNTELPGPIVKAVF